MHVEAAANLLPVIAFDVAANRESILQLRGGELLPFRDQKVLHDLAAAMARTFLLLHSGGSGIDGSRRRFVDGENTDRSNNGDEELEEVAVACATVREMYTYWNCKQHSIALMDSLDEMLKNPPG